MTGVQVSWLRCPGCAKAHLASHGTDGRGILTCPCGVKFSAFTGQRVA